MDRFWLKNYPQDVPADVDAGRYESLIQFLDEASRSTAARARTASWVPR